MIKNWIFPLLLAPFCILGFADGPSSERRRLVEQDVYQGMMEASLNHEQGILRARIETDDLVMLSLSWDQLEDYVQLFGDPVAVEKYTDGTPWMLDEVKEFMTMWMNRWNKYEDPYSAFAIFEKSSGQPFIGHFVLGHGGTPGQAEIAFLFKPEYWGHGYATQAVTAMLYRYIPLLIERQYPANHFDQEVHEARLEVVHATSRVDNGFASVPFKRAGMKVGEIELIWGHPRFHFSITADEIMNISDDQGTGH